MKNFVDLYSHKSNDEIQAHVVNFHIDKGVYDKLKSFGASKAVKYLILKYFNITNVSKAISQYDADLIEYVETGKRVNVTSYFDKEHYSYLEKISNKVGVSVNFAAKVLVYYLMWKSGSNGITPYAVVNKSRKTQKKSGGKKK